jgi:1-aminocyclopropane-1-carboxylate deaminase/D-cysteine desulfhydrase-like pyridoxal-dependent ACC family enzyme
MVITNAWAAREQAVFIQALPDFVPEVPGVSVSMLRLDVLHPLVSGNKWFKLKYHLQAALDAGKQGVLTFGGAYSNHLIATAAAAESYKLAAIGMARGMHAAQELTPVLQACKDMGMELQFLSREAYSQKEDPAQLQSWQAQYPGYYFIPEGGATAEGRKGAGEIARFIDDTYTHVCLSVGSGTTFAGLRQALPLSQAMLGFVPMKGGAYLAESLQEWIGPEHDARWELTDAFHFGGFGKINEELRLFMTAFQQQYRFALDRVYTAKMMAGLRSLIASGAFAKGAKILCIHTGGLSGN